MTLYELANKIIEEKGGEAYKEEWLRRWLQEPENEDEFMSLLLKKETADAMKNKPKKNVPPKIQ